MNSEQRKILLVDDSELTLLLQAEILSDEGFEVRTATSVADVDGILQSWAPDVVLTDVRMPDGDGPELCRLIKSRGGQLAVVILFSSLPDLELERLAQACGADGYLSKSHGLDSLPERVEAVLQSVTR